jgi:hypothetical protein
MPGSIAPSRWDTTHGVYNRPAPITPPDAFDRGSAPRNTFSDLIADLAVMLVGSTLALTLINYAVQMFDSSGISPAAAAGIGALGAAAVVSRRAEPDIDPRTGLQRGGMESIPSTALQDMDDDGDVIDPSTGRFRESTITENVVRMFINLCERIWNASSTVGIATAGSFQENIVPALLSAAGTIRRRSGPIAREMARNARSVALENDPFQELPEPSPRRLSRTSSGERARDAKRRRGL